MDKKYRPKISDINAIYNSNFGTELLFEVKILTKYIFVGRNGFQITGTNFNFTDFPILVKFPEQIEELRHLLKTKKHIYDYELESNFLEIVSANSAIIIDHFTKRNNDLVMNRYFYLLC